MKRNNSTADCTYCVLNIQLFAAALTAALFLCSAVSAQEALKSTEEEYYDFLSLTGVVSKPTLGYRTLSDSVWTFNTDAEGNSLAESNANVWECNNLGRLFSFWTPKTLSDNWYLKGVKQVFSCKVYGPDWYNSYNTAAPSGQNDGALWQGVGYNTSLTAGVRLEAYGFELTLKPQVCFSQNLDFEIMASNYDSPYGYFWGTENNVGIDLPQRFGDQPFCTFDWGDTEIRYTWKTLTAGFGTQSPWLGPAWLNPMLGSNNAATYPKLDFGIRKTSLYVPWLGWYIGDVEARVFTGYLSESDYFDNDSSNDHNMLNALNASFAPSVLPGLTIGFNRVFVTKWDMDYYLPYLGRLFFYSTDNTVEDQKASFYADWLMTKSGVEIYGELGIDDYENSGDVVDYIRYPFHTMDYTVGLKKAVDIKPDKQIRGELIFEWNNFEMSQDFQLQWKYMGMYSHSLITQGYTNRGQIIGAGSGSMGNSQYLGFVVYYPKGKSTVFIHRANPDNNYIYSKAVDASASDKDANGYTLETYYFTAFKATFDVGIQSEYFVTNSLSVSGGFIYELIVNPLYEGFSGNYVTENNFIFQGGLKYRF